MASDHYLGGEFGTAIGFIGTGCSYGQDAVGGDDGRHYVFAAWAQDVEVKKVPIQPSGANSAVQMYRAYCAACHGWKGTGDGPAVPALTTVSSDLTALNARNEGKFPSARVASVLRGNNEINAHGSSEMPIEGAAVPHDGYGR